MKTTNKADGMRGLKKFESGVVYFGLPLSDLYRSWESS
jgi:hypothetical protein